MRHLRHELVAGSDGDTSVMQPSWHPTSGSLWFISDKSGYLFTGRNLEALPHPVAHTFHRSQIPVSYFGEGLRELKNSSMSRVKIFSKTSTVKASGVHRIPPVWVMKESSTFSARSFI